MYRQTDDWTGGETDGHTDRGTDGHTDEISCMQPIQVLHCEKTFSCCSANIFSLIDFFQTCTKNWTIVASRVKNLVVVA
jgi:hypothetical protein